MTQKAWKKNKIWSFRYSLVKLINWKSSYKDGTAAAAKSLQSCPTLCDPIDSSPPGSPVPGILQARTLEWVAISFSNAWKWKVKVKSLSRVWLFSNPMNCSLPGSSIIGIFQARVLEWGAIAFSKDGTSLYQLLGKFHQIFLEQIIKNMYSLNHMKKKIFPNCVKTKGITVPDGII